MHDLKDFAEIVKTEEPLAPYTRLQVGGPAEFLVEPRSKEELAAVVRQCLQKGIALRVLGAGSEVLVRDEGVRGVVLRLSAPAFTQVSVDGRRVRAGAGAPLSALISQSVRHALAGLESLVGIPGTAGGAVRGNAGDRAGEVGQYVRQVEALDGQGQFQVRERDELRFAYRWSNLDDPVLVSVEVELEADQREAIFKRMLKAWIQRQAGQPLSFQPSSRLFKDPRGAHAADLIQQAGLAKTRVGGAEISERNADFVVAHPGTTARDVLRLADLVKSRVQERSGVDLELELAVW